MNIAPLPDFLADLLSAEQDPSRDAVPKSAAETTAYGKAAMIGLIADIKAVEPGSRNGRLNTIAVKFGSLVGGGEIPLEIAQRTFIDHALATGHDSQKVYDMAERSIRDGMRKPRTSNRDGKPIEMGQRITFPDAHGRARGYSGEGDDHRVFGADHDTQLEFVSIQSVKRPVRKWLIKGFWLCGSYGEIAGGEKSFKSYITKAEVVAVASGRPMLNTWEVGQQGPVSVMVGEGGAAQWMWDALQIAKAMGMSEEEFNALPIRLTDQHATIESEKFQEGVARHLDEFKPVLFVIDPLYTYYGEGSGAGNLFDAARTLNAVSNLTRPRGVALQIVNHTKKGSNRDLELEAITQAGHREWVDSWVIMDKRSEDVDEGIFEIQMRVGGRNAGTRFFTVTLDLGPFDDENLSHEREPKWEIERAKSASKSTSSTSAADRMTTHIRQILTDRPFELTKSELAKEVGGNRQRAMARIDEMCSLGSLGVSEIEKRTVEITDGRGHQRTKEVLALLISGTCEKP